MLLNYIYNFSLIFAAAAVFLLNAGSVSAQTCTYTPTSSDYATSSVNIASDGNYYIWSRILAPDAVNNSYYLQIDGGCAINIGDSSEIPVNSLTWVNYQDGSSSQVVLLNLKAGDHVIKITQREGGVGLDKIIFTSDAACIPSGKGENCPAVTATPGNSPTPSPIPATSTPSPIPSGNLVKNGGFEEAGDWQAGFWTSSKGTIARNSSDKHSENYSFMIDGDSTSSSGQVYSGASNKFAVKTGDTFIYKAWYKGTNTYLVTKWFDSSGKQLAMDSFPLANTGSWSQASVNPKAPANAVQLWIFVQTRATDKPAYFDDLELYPATSTTNTPAPTTAPTNTPTPSLSPTPSLTPTATLTPVPTLTSAPTLTPTITPTQIPTPTPTPSPTSAPVTPSPTISASNGLTGTYYDNNNFTGTTVTRIDPTINFSWGSASPVSGISAYTFSVVWTGYIIPKYSEEYKIFFKTDDGARVWVNGTKLIDSWKGQSATEYSGKITLAKDQRYAIRIEYYQNWGGSAAQLRWSSSTQAKEIVPQSQLSSK